jgi:predicted nicotinamide N-methyase
LEALQTDAGEFPLNEYRLRLAGREWSILHTHAMLTTADEAHFFRGLRNRVPYGVALWPAAIALAHEIAARPDVFHGRSVLELGAGTGLPGIVAEAFGARVHQTDRHELALAVCRRNGERNAARGISYALADWNSWGEPAPYDWVIGSDILYAEALHQPLQEIFAGSLAPGGRVLLADPFRGESLRLLERLEGAGWRVTVSKWSVGEAEEPRAVGVFELTPPGGDRRQEGR